MRQVSMQQAAQRNAGGVRLAASPQDGSSSSSSSSERGGSSGLGTGGSSAEVEGKRTRLRTLSKQLIQLPKQADVAVIEEMLSDQGLVAHNLTTLLLNLKKRNKWRAAVLIADWAETDSCTLRLTTTHYNLLLSACARRAPKRTLDLLSRMLERGVATNVVTHNTAMSAALNLDDHVHALELFDQMRALGHEPTTISYNTAINACARAADAERALALFREMEAAGIERSTVTYTGLIHACAEGGQLDKAMALFTYMDVAGVERNPVTYCVAINGCTRNGQWELGLQLLHEMARKGVRCVAHLRRWICAHASCRTAASALAPIDPFIPAPPYRPLQLIAFVLSSLSGRIRWSSTQRFQRAKRDVRGRRPFGLCSR